MADSESTPMTPEYSRRLAELENYISDNRLVSKEAQMSLLSGQGYKDPRFIPTTGNELIDKFGLYPLAAEGSGQVLSTGQLGMEGADSVRNPNIPGQYYSNDFRGVSKDTLRYKNHPFYDALGYSAEQVQKHELVHRAAVRSGYDNYYPNSEFLKENATTSLFSGKTGNVLRPLIREVLAHSYERGDDFDEKFFKENIYSRAKKFNIRNPTEIADELMENIDVLKQDFERYLTALTNPDEIPNRMDEIMVENDF